MTTTRAAGEDGAGAAFASLLARAGSRVVVAWTRELRVAAERVEPVPCVLGPRESIARARVLSERTTFAHAPGLPSQPHVPLALVLVHVEGEQVPRWISRDRMSADALACAAPTTRARCAAL